MSYVTTKRMLYSDCPEVVLGESICACFGCHARSSSLLFLPLPVCKVYSVASQSPPSTLSPERTGMSRIFSSALSEQCTPEKKFKQFDHSLKINRHTKLSSSFFQVFFSTPNSLMIVLVTPNYHQLLLDTENYRKSIIK